MTPPRRPDRRQADAARALARASPADHRHRHDDGRRVREAPSPRSGPGVSVDAILGAILLLFFLRDVTPDPYSAVFLNDAMSGYARLGFLLGALVLLGLAHGQVDDARSAEFYGCLLMLHAGAMLVAGANDLVFLFVGLELVSIPTYLLLYLSRRDKTTREAATKYFFLSIFSSALLLFGFAYLYGLAGVSNLKALAYLVHWHSNNLPLPQPQLATIALIFVVAGLGFRVAAVPFHWYAPTFTRARLPSWRRSWPGCPRVSASWP